MGWHEYDWWSRWMGFLSRVKKAARYFRWHQYFLAIHFTSSVDFTHTPGAGPFSNSICKYLQEQKNLGGAGYLSSTDPHHLENQDKLLPRRGIDSQHCGTPTRSRPTIPSCRLTRPGPVLDLGRCITRHIPYFRLSIIWGSSTVFMTVTTYGWYSSPRYSCSTTCPFRSFAPF